MEKQYSQLQLSKVDSHHNHPFYCGTNSDHMTQCTHNTTASQQLNDSKLITGTAAVLPVAVNANRCPLGTPSTTSAKLVLQQQPPG
jgi:hypothetical protein